MKVLIASLLCLLSCAEPSRTSPKNISPNLENVMTIDFGRALKNDVLTSLGAPDRRVLLKGQLAGKETLIYLDKSKSPNLERLALLVDSTTKIVQSATWSVHDTDRFKTKSQIINYFADAKFKGKEVGQVSSDYYSNDTVYVDQALGISFYVNESSGEVQSISFEEKK